MSIFGNFAGAPQAKIAILRMLWRLRLKFKGFWASADARAKIFEYFAGKQHIFSSERNAA